MSTQPPLTQMAHGAGCGCKIAPGVLTEILASMPVPVADPNVLVGNRDMDDAAVYRMDDGTAIVATLDFFTPIVDDPATFGRIAATNAINDVYAMGGTPLLALAVVGYPKDGDLDVLLKMIKRMCADEGCGLRELLHIQSMPLKITKMGFGKHKGTSLADLPKSYVSWMLKDCKNLDPDLRTALSAL